VGHPARGRAAPWPAISGDGRFAAFVFAGRLVEEDTNGRSDVYVRDRVEDAVELVSLGADGGPADAGSWGEVDISDDGRFVVFTSRATNLVDGGADGNRNVFLRDRLAGTTTLVSGAPGVVADGPSWEPAISGDGRYVAFRSRAPNLVPGDTNRRSDVLVWDRLDSSVERVSVSSRGTQTQTWSRWPELSYDGRFVTFGSRSHLLVRGDTNRRVDVFLHDRESGTTERVSLGAEGQQGRGHSMESAVSADGRFVAFASHAGNLVAGDRNGLGDVFVRDRQEDATVAASVDSSGRIRGGGSYDPGISADGRYVVFDSSAPLTPPPPWINDDVFVHDLVTGATRLVSVPAEGDSGGGISPQISADGHHVVWWSSSSSLVTDDEDGLDTDVFVRDQR
jgi:Tol biopolymer transport system component